MININTIRSDFLLNETHWKQGYRVTEEGQLARDPGLAGLFMRWVRWVWRAFVAHPDQFDELVINKFRELARSLSRIDNLDVLEGELTQLPTGDFPRFPDKVELHQALLKAQRVFEQNVERLQEENAEIEPDVWRLIQNSFLRNLTVNIESQIILNNQEFLAENLQRGAIEELVDDPGNGFDETEVIETPYGHFSVTSQFLQDFHRCSIFIDGAINYGEYFPGKNVRGLIEELFEKEFQQEEIEHLLRFCSQTSTNSIAHMMAPYIQEFAENEPESALQKKVEYHIQTSEKDKLTFHALTVKELRNGGLRSHFAGIVTYQFQDEYFSSGDISTKLARIPCNFR